VLREGELFRLALEDIDFDEKIVQVRRQLKKLGKHYVFALPKNDRERTVPLPEWTGTAHQGARGEVQAATLLAALGEPEGKLRTRATCCSAGPMAGI
jgi:integrase